MVVVGSFANDDSLNPVVIAAMCLETTRESVEGLKKTIQDLTPFGPSAHYPEESTGALRESVMETPITKPFANRYKSNVQSLLHYAPYIEFGTAPHSIDPNKPKAVLRYWNGVLSSHSDHPGNEGVHMFQRGAELFEKTAAEPIARKNVKKYLQ